MASVLHVGRVSPRVLAIAAAVLLAALVVVVGVLPRLDSGHGSPVGTSSLTVGVENAPPPPQDALVLAGESGTRAVALAVEPGARPRLTATVLAPTGRPLSGLSVSFLVGREVVRALPCGPGCYHGNPLQSSGAKRIEVRPSGSRAVAFTLPDSPRPATAILARATRVFRFLQSLVYVESLRSGPTGGIVTTWKMVAPDRLSYQIKGGAAAVVIGRRRWDQSRPRAGWARSSQIPPLRVPQPSWGGVTANAHVLSTGRLGGRPVWIVSFDNPTIPAWFTAWIDRRTYRTFQLRMTAAAHFMFHRYLAFDRPLRITPPT
jgi:hypothetical protein